MRRIIKDQEKLAQALDAAKALNAAAPAPSAATPDGKAHTAAGRQQLPHPEPFDSREKSLFLLWKIAIIIKLTIKGAVIGDPRA